MAAQSSKESRAFSRKHDSNRRRATATTTARWSGRKAIRHRPEISARREDMLWHEVISDFTLTSFTKTGDMGEVGGPLSRVV